MGLADYTLGTVLRSDPLIGAALGGSSSGTAMIHRLLRPTACRWSIVSRRYITGAANRALVLNAGSSSIKYGVFDLSSEASICSGLVEKIGVPGGAITHKMQDGTKKKTETHLPDHAFALEQVVEILTAPGGAIGNVEEIGVVGHRVVHGGASLTKPTIIDDRVEAAIESCVPLAPLHNPANLLGIRVARGLFASPHVAVFDTAFHSTMPPESYLYALPHALAEEHGVRRYGFHGTSYTFVLEKAAELLGKPVDQVPPILIGLLITSNRRRHRLMTAC